MKPYIIEFEEDGTMKPKIYSDDYIIEDLNQQLVIIITYDKYIFLQIMVFDRRKQNKRIYIYDPKNIIKKS